MDFFEIHLGQLFNIWYFVQNSLSVAIIIYVKNTFMHHNFFKQSLYTFKFEQNDARCVCITEHDGTSLICDSHILFDQFEFE